MFFDLVFVFAVTQLSHGLLAHFSLVGAIETLILFLAVWWLWIYTCWATNWLDPDAGSVRFMLIAMMIGATVLGIAIPGAFGEFGSLFALTYCSLQIGRTAYLAWAYRYVSKEGFQNARRILMWFLLALPFWVGGVTWGHEHQLAYWAAAIAVEYCGPVAYYRFPGLGRSTSSDWNISGAHMAERCSLFIIIALGEAIVVTGGTMANIGFSDWTNAAFASSLVGSVALWWIYFDTGVHRGVMRIESTDDSGRVGRNAYTFLHIPIVAGIIVTAVADALAIEDPRMSADASYLAVTFGGAALFIFGNLLFKWDAASWRRIPKSHVKGLVLLAIGLTVLLIFPLSRALASIVTTVTLILIAMMEWRVMGRGRATAILGQV